MAKFKNRSRSETRCRCAAGDLRQAVTRGGKPGTSRSDDRFLKGPEIPRAHRIQEGVMQNGLYVALSAEVALRNAGSRRSPTISPT